MITEKKIKSQVRVSKEMLESTSIDAKKMVEFDVAVNILKEMPHKDLIRLFNIQWREDRFYPEGKRQVVTGEINYRDPFWIDKR